MRVREIDRERRERRASETRGGGGGGGGSIARRSTMATKASTNDEVLKAQEAHLKGLDDKDERTIFDKIISKEIPATVIYEDELALAFRDIAPQAKTHFLVIPKIRAGLTRLSRATEDHKMLLGHLMYTASVVAKQEKLDAGYRCVITTASRVVRACITFTCTSWADNSYRGRRERIKRVTRFSRPLVCALESRSACKKMMIYYQNMCVYGFHNSL